MFVNNAAKLSM